MDERQQDALWGQQPALPPTTDARRPATDLDHAWIVEAVDQQYGLGAPGDQEHTSLWMARARCAHCGLRVEFVARDVPPCHPGARR